MSVTVRLTQLLLAGACLSAVPFAAAQTPADPAAAPVETTTTSTVEATGEDSEELTVTATRRATNIQKTAIAITAVSEKAIENAGIRETQSLIAVVPSLQFPQSESSGSVTARIRGVGTQGSNPGLESAVGIFIDGVYRSRNSVAFGDLGDIKRIEVLRGPQGTLFGRNTSAGLISVITREPSLDETVATASATYESFNGYYINGGITAPLTENVAGIRLYGSYRKRDGYMDLNPGIPGERDGNLKEGWNLRGQLLWKPAEETTVRFIIDAAQKDEECCYAGTIRPSSFGARGPTGPTGAAVIQGILGYQGTPTTNTVEDQIGYANRDNPQLVNEFGFSGEVIHNFNDMTFTSITAYRDWKLEGGADSDYTAADLWWADGNVGYQHFKTFTQEFRLAGSDFGIDWLIGAFYSNETLERETSLLNGSHIESYLSRFNVGNDTPGGIPALRAALANVPLVRPGSPAYNQALNTLPLGSGYNDTYEQGDESIAFFTHNVINVTDAFKITLGLRYTYEVKDIEATYRTFGGNGCQYLESIWGLNPAGVFAPGVGNAAGSSGVAAAVLCLPNTRSVLDVLTATAPIQQEKKEDEFSGILTFAYEFNEDFNAYATYSRGYKAGGFNLDRYYNTDDGTQTGQSIVRCPDGSSGRPAQTNPATGAIVVAADPYTCARPSILVTPDLSFAPEFVNSFEVGFKSSLAGGNLQLNVAAFYQDFENYQLNTFNGVVFVVTPVPEVISKGIEVDANWFTDIDGLSFNAGVAYTLATYGEDLGTYTNRHTFLFENPPLFLLPGNNLTSAPEWTLTGGFTYEFPIADGAWNGLVHADARYVSDQVGGSNLDPAKTQEGYTIVNARIGFTSEDELISVEFWAKNLFDERYFQIAFDAPLQGNSPSAFTATAAGSLNATTPATFSRIGAFLGEPQSLGITIKTRF